ncbi:MAG: glycosyltransferase family 4 protein [Candidatus Heimdallarchaeota archaeon]|nr:glycosyltransferase family 4 protein [Candidatus Heimdallarchaeota archaeon]
MKILHINSIAAIPQILAKFQSRAGHKVKIIDIAKGDYFNKFDFYSIYPTKVIGSRPKAIILRSILNSFQADIVHIHSSISILNWIKKVAPRKKTVITFHGTVIRDKWNKYRKDVQKANFVSVATKDLLRGAPESVVHVPNPIDTEHFNRENDYTKNLALFIYIKESGQEEALKKAKKEAKKRGLVLLTQKRHEWLIPYSSFPRFLENFEYFIDFRQSINSGEFIDDLSTTALQQLALGGKVLFQEKVLTSFPNEYQAQNVAQRWIEIYQSL